MYTLRLFLKGCSYIKKENTLRSAQLENANSELAQQNEDLRNTIQRLNQQIEDLQYAKEKDDKIKTLITKKLNSNFIDIVFGKLVKESKVKNKDTLRRKYGQHLLNNIDGFLEYVLDFKEYINRS